MIEPPDRHPFLLRLATRLLNKAESGSRGTDQKRVRLRLDRRVAPELYGLNDADQLQSFVLLIESWCQCGYIELQLSPRREFAGFVDRNPQIVLCDFDALAKWAGYEPLATRWQQQWLAFLRGRFVASSGALTSDHHKLLDYLARNPLLALQGLALEEGAASLDRLRDLCNAKQPYYLREASAHAFQGRSKVLDHREELLRLIGAAAGQFQEAPIQLLVDVPPEVENVLFIENLVSYERMADHRKPAWSRSLLVYASGFRGSAARLRSDNGNRLYLRAGAQSSTESAERLARSWLHGALDLPVYFFGDLDYAGMQILSSLRDAFPSAKAWLPGYRLLAQAVERGGGHSPAHAGKENQVDPRLTGCSYADLFLLPLLRAQDRFVDQEIFVSIYEEMQLSMSTDQLPFGTSSAIRITS